MEEAKTIRLTFLSMTVLTMSLTNISFLPCLSLIKVLQSVMDHYRPGAVVLQCGADSLAGDRLGCFNLSMKGHAYPLEFMKKFNVPIMVLGGGGYTIRNVCRAWTYETAMCVDEQLNESTPI